MELMNIKQQFHFIYLWDETFSRASSLPLRFRIDGLLDGSAESLHSFRSLEHHRKMKSRNGNKKINIWSLSFAGDDLRTLFSCLRTNCCPSVRNRNNFCFSSSLNAIIKLRVSYFKSGVASTGTFCISCWLWKARRVIYFWVGLGLITEATE